MRMKGCREQWRQMRQPGVEETAKSPSLVRAVWVWVRNGKNFRFWIDPKRHTQVLVMSKPSLKKKATFDPYNDKSLPSV